MRTRIGISAALILVFAATSAGAGSGFRAVTAGGAEWRAGAGADVARRGGNHGLFMQTFALHPGGPPNQGEGGAFVDLEGVAGITLTELGFDVRNDEVCTDWDPTVFVTIEPDGDQFHFDCTAGIRTPAPANPLNWTRVRFTTASDDPNGEWPGFGNVVVRDIWLNYLDTTWGKHTHLDNLDVNGVLIGGPGSY